MRLESNARTGAREEEETETGRLSASSSSLAPAFRPCPFPFSPHPRLASISFPYPLSRAKTHAVHYLYSRQARAAGNMESRRQDRVARDNSKPIKMNCSPSRLQSSW